MSIVSPSSIKPTWLRLIRFGCVFACLSLNLMLGYYLYRNYQKQTDELNIANLNEKVWIYKEKVGTLPDLNLIDLYHHGLTKKRLHETPFGGYYRLNPKLPAVYNPNLVNR